MQGQRNNRDKLTAYGQNAIILESSPLIYENLLSYCCNQNIENMYYLLNGLNIMLDKDIFDGNSYKLYQNKVILQLQAIASKYPIVKTASGFKKISNKPTIPDDNAILVDCRFNNAKGYQFLSDCSFINTQEFEFLYEVFKHAFQYIPEKNTVQYWSHFIWDKTYIYNLDKLMNTYHSYQTLSNIKTFNGKTPIQLLDFIFNGIKNIQKTEINTVQYKIFPAEDGTLKYIYRLYQCLIPKTLLNTLKQQFNISIYSEIIHHDIKSIQPSRNYEFQQLYQTIVQGFETNKTNIDKCIEVSKALLNITPNNKSKDDYHSNILQMYQLISNQNVNPYPISMNFDIFRLSDQYINVFIMKSLIQHKTIQECAQAYGKSETDFISFLNKWYRSISFNNSNFDLINDSQNSSLFRMRKAPQSKPTQAVYVPNMLGLFIDANYCYYPDKIIPQKLVEFSNKFGKESFQNYLLNQSIHFNVNCITRKELCNRLDDSMYDEYQKCREKGPIPELLIEKSTYLIYNLFEGLFEKREQDQKKKKEEAERQKSFPFQKTAETEFFDIQKDGFPKFSEIAQNIVNLTQKDQNQKKDKLINDCKNEITKITKENTVLKHKAGEWDKIQKRYGNVTAEEIIEMIQQGKLPTQKLPQTDKLSNHQSPFMQNQQLPIIQNQPSHGTQSSFGNFYIPSPRYHYSRATRQQAHNYVNSIINQTPKKETCVVKAIKYLYNYLIRLNTSPADSKINGIQLLSLDENKFEPNPNYEGNYDIVVELDNGWTYRIIVRATEQDINFDGFPLVLKELQLKFFQDENDDEGHYYETTLALFWNSNTPSIQNSVFLTRSRINQLIFGLDPINANAENDEEGDD